MKLDTVYIMKHVEIPISIVECGFLSNLEEEKQLLDLSECEKETIEIHYQLNTSMINMTKLSYYLDLGIDIFNIEDDFFNKIFVIIFKGEI